MILQYSIVLSFKGVIHHIAIFNCNALQDSNTVQYLIALPFRTVI